MKQQHYTSFTTSSLRPFVHETEDKTTTKKRTSSSSSRTLVNSTTDGFASAMMIDDDDFGRLCVVCTKRVVERLFVDSLILRKGSLFFDFFSSSSFSPPFSV